MSTMTFTCPPPPNAAPYQITIAQGFPATFQLQIVPDSTFSGPVTLTCPLNLPDAQGGAPTTCGISSGTAVTLPLVRTLTVNVVANTPFPFTITFQTTDTKGNQFPAPTTKGAKLSAALGAIFSGKHDGDDTKGSGTSGTIAANAGSPFTRDFASIRQLNWLPTMFSIALAFCGIILLSLPALRRQRSPRLIAVCALGMLLITVAASVGGCKSYSSGTSLIPYTPTGTYQLTVQGSAQNGSRGFTMTLVVD
jgi:hypothetical protein